MMKFFTAAVLGITFMFGFVNSSESVTQQELIENDDEQSYSFESIKKNFDPFIIPGNICIVNTEGTTRTFNSCAYECLNKEHSWFKISIGDPIIKYK